MSFFEFPHTRTYDSDLGWLIKKMGELIQEYGSLDSWKEQHEIEYKDLAEKVNGLINSLVDVITPWDAGIAYQIFTIVSYQGTNYIALQDVPVGIMIDNTDYWQPANTVTQQINAIATIVSEMQENWCVVGTFAELAATTADRVLVLNDDSYYGSGQAVWFEKAPNDLTEIDYLQRNNGDYMQPAPRTDAIDNNVPYNELGKVVASYVNNRNITYGNGGTPFSLTPDMHQDCSTFTQCVIQGISFEHSRLAQNTNDYSDYVGDNIPKNRASYYDTNRPYGYKVQGLALWMAEQNRLFYLDYTKPHPCTQLKTGDIIFEGNSSTYQYAPAEERYLKAGHCAVVLYVYPDTDAVLVAQCGNFHHRSLYTQMQGMNYQRNDCKITLIGIDSGSQEAIRVYARPGYFAGNSNPDSVLSEIANQVKAAAPITINANNLGGYLGNIRFKRPLEKGKMYTLVATGKLPTEDEHTVLDIGSETSGEGTVQMAFTALMRIKNKLVFPFVPFDDLSLPQLLRIRANVYPRSAETIGGLSYQYYLDNFDIYEGIVNDPDAVGYDCSSECTKDSRLTFTVLRVTKLADRLRVRFTCHLNEAVTAATRIALVTIPPEYMPASMNVMLRPVLFVATNDYHQAEIDNNGNVQVTVGASAGTGNIHGDFWL